MQVDGAQRESELETLHLQTGEQVSAEWKPAGVHFRAAGVL